MFEKRYKSHHDVKDVINKLTKKSIVTPFTFNSRTEALEIMNTLSRFGYIRYTLDEKTKKLESMFILPIVIKFAHSVI